MEITVRYELSDDEIKRAFASEGNFIGFISKHSDAIATKAEDEYIIANVKELTKIVKEIEQK